MRPATAATSRSSIFIPTRTTPRRWSIRRRTRSIGYWGEKADWAVTLAGRPANQWRFRGDQPISCWLNVDRPEYMIVAPIRPCLRLAEPKYRNGKHNKWGYNQQKPGRVHTSCANHRHVQIREDLPQPDIRLIDNLEIALDFKDGCLVDFCCHNLREIYPLYYGYRLVAPTLQDRVSLFLLADLASNYHESEIVSGLKEPVL